MRLDPVQIIAAGELLRLLQRKIGADTQDALAGQLGKLAKHDILSADLSKLRRGYLPDGKWQALLSALEQMAQNQDMSAPEAAGARSHLLELRRAPFEVRLANLEAVLADEWLRSAYYEWLWHRKRNPAFAKLTEGEGLDITITTGWYSKIDVSLQDALATVVREQTAKSSRILRPVDSKYHELYRWVTANTSPVICTYPFFYTHQRRSTWGCVRYGWQRRIGILGPKIHVEGMPPVIHSADFVQLLRDSPSIEHLAGYSVHEIVFEMLVALQRIDLLNQFREKLTYEPLVDLTSALQRLGPTSVFLFDLADRPLVNACMEASANLQYLKVCELEHEQTIPVGIGFSLPLFPWLADRKRFELLHRTAVAALVHLRQRFLDELGIELD